MVLNFIKYQKMVGVNILQHEFYTIFVPLDVSKNLKYI